MRAVAHTFLERLDDECTIEGAEAHHLSRVRRLRAGEVVTAADGYGRWRIYDVARAGGSALTLRATSDVAHEPRLAPALTVASALTKGDRPELVVQKLTELGVDAVVLLRAARSVVRWDDDRAATALDRLRRVAREAAAQSRRAHLPRVDGVVDALDLAGRPGLVLADPRGAPVSALDEPADGWVVAVGPEGGFDERELAAFAAAPRLAVGPHVLRAETAAVASAAALAGRRRVAP